MLLDEGGGEFASVLDVQSSFFNKENLICAMTRHHANNILFTRNRPFDSDIRQLNHLLMITLNCLWAKSNNSTPCQFEYGMSLCIYLFIYLFIQCFCLNSFIHMHGAVVVWNNKVCLRFQVIQLKQVDCKMSTKKSFF